MRLIGLTGLPGAGKDSVARLLAQKQAFAQMSFAGPLKDGLITMLGLNRADLQDPLAKERTIEWIGKSPRQLMQTLGTEWGRGLVREDIWIRHAQRRLDNYRRFSAKVVVTDVRYPNEADWLRRNGGELWHIQRRLAENVVNLHTSNIPLAVLPGSDSVIPNDEGLAQLEERVRQAFAGELRITTLTA